MRRIARALALCFLLSLFSLGCGILPSPAPPVEAPEEASISTDERVAAISRDAILILRRLNVSNLAFLGETLSPAKYRLALDFLIPDIQALAQQMVEVSISGSPPASPGLLESVDSLARAAGEFRRYIDSGEDSALAAAYPLLAEAQLQLKNFLTTSALAEGPELLNLLQEAGHIEVNVETTAVSRVALGPFSTDEVALEVQKAAAAHNAEIRKDGLPMVWLGPFLVAAEARVVAAQWRERNVEAAVHEDTVYAFQVNEVSPVQGRNWTETVWANDMDFLTHFIAVSPDGSVVLAGDTSGVVQRLSGLGAKQWTQTLTLPTFALAAARNGEGIFAAGIGVQALRGDGTERWRDSLAGFEIVLESAEMSNDGQFMVAASSNEEGTGQAFGFNAAGLAWFTPDNLGVNSFYLSPDGAPIALGAVGEGRFQVLVLNERGEKIMGSDFIEPVVDVALAGLNQKVAVLTQRNVSKFDIASQQIEWQRPARGRTLAVSQPGDIIYVGGVHGVSAFYADGCKLWEQDALPVSRIVANRDYLVGLSENIRLVVLRFDGSVLGTVSPLAPLRDFAVAEDGKLLITLDEENRLSAWHLPTPEINEIPYPC